MFLLLTTYCRLLLFCDEEYNDILTRRYAPEDLKTTHFYPGQISGLNIVAIQFRTQSTLSPEESHLYCHWKRQRQCITLNAKHCNGGDQISVCWRSIFTSDRFQEFLAHKTTSSGSSDWEKIEGWYTWSLSPKTLLNFCILMFQTYIFSRISKGFHSDDVPLSVQISVPLWRKICEYRQNIDLSQKCAYHYTHIKIDYMRPMYKFVAQNYSDFTTLNMIVFTKLDTNLILTQIL